LLQSGHLVAVKFYKKATKKAPTVMGTSHAQQGHEGTVGAVLWPLRLLWVAFTRSDLHAVAIADGEAPGAR
jgi:hypothetical protein